MISARPNTATPIPDGRVGIRESRRRRLLLTFGSALVAPGLVVAQTASAIPRIGLLWIAGDNSGEYILSLREGLRDAGYVVGRNIAIDDRFLVSDYAQLSDAARRLVAEGVALIVTYGATATVQASKATTTVPIVVVAGGDPVKLGVAASLSRPGGNVTGLTRISQDLSGKRLELLKEIAPGMRRVAVVLFPESTAEVSSLRDFEAAARTLNLEVRPVEVRTLQEIEPAISNIGALGAQGIAVVGSSLFSANRKRLLTAINRLRLPAVYASGEFPMVGGLLAYSADLSEHFRRVAGHIDKILKGANPGDIPIEQPNKIELVVNKTTASALGIRIPASILARADRVIE